MTAEAAKLLMRALLTVLLLLSVVLPASAQNAGAATDPVLPPPRSAIPPPPATPMPALGAPLAAPNPGPFAPPPPPPPSSPFAPPDAHDPIYQPSDPGRSGWGLYDWPSLAEQLFADVEVDILKPHLKAALSEAVTFPDGSAVNVQPPTTQVGWTAAPRVEVGWFLPQSLGYFAISYRGFADQAEQNALALDGTPFALRTRLDVNQAAFDYGTVPYSYAPRWFLAGRIGIGGADVFFDNRAVSSAQTQYASNTFYGAGPHVRLDLWREFNLLPGLSVFAQPDLTVLVGQIRQHYSEDIIGLDGNSVQGFFLQRKTQTVPVLALRTGLSYTPRNFDRWRFMVGYEYEEWWFVGQVDGLNPRGQFSTNGVFLRAFVSF
jgi:hypothetical protein